MTQTRPESAGHPRIRLADIPVRAAEATLSGNEGNSSPACEGGDLFALRVLGDDMLPEFSDGDILVVEPGGLARDGSFVVARPHGEWVFRQLRDLSGCWTLVALNTELNVAAETISDLACIRGVVVQKSCPGRRRETKRYVE